MKKIITLSIVTIMLSGGIVLASSSLNNAKANETKNINQLQDTTDNNIGTEMSKEEEAKINKQEFESFKKLSKENQEYIYNIESLNEQGMEAFEEALDKKLDESNYSEEQEQKIAEETLKEIIKNKEYVMLDPKIIQENIEKLYMDELTVEDLIKMNKK